MNWFDRRFSLDAPLGIFPGVVERLRGTPARLTEQVGEMPANILLLPPDNGWSIHEHVGHLGDLEELWVGRLSDLLNGADVMREADLTNRRTHEARHNEVPLERLLGRFRVKRKALVTRLETLSEAEIGRTSLHPRLNVTMRSLDLALFVAEHDDHHLARIGEVLRRAPAHS